MPMVFLLAAALVLGAMTATGTAAGQQPALADPAQPLAFAIRYAASYKRGLDRRHV